MVASALSLTFALALLASWAITRRGGWMPSSQQYVLYTNGGGFEFVVAVGQSTFSVPGHPNQSVIMYRRVLSFPLWPAIGAGLVLPIICACCLIMGRRSTARGFEVIATGPRPLIADPLFAHS
jgi:hypothetical protein